MQGWLSLQMGVGWMESRGMPINIATLHVSFDTAESSSVDISRMKTSIFWLFVFPINCHTMNKGLLVMT